MEQGAATSAGAENGKVAKMKVHGGVSKKNNKKKSKKGSVGHQIRGLERLLAHIGDKMAPAAKRAKEAELKSLKALHADRGRRQKEVDNSNKYRMVKFFERRKVERQLKKVRGKLDDASIKKQKQLARDLHYITAYPKDCKYVSLFPSGGHTEASRKVVEDMRQRIEGTDEPVSGDAGDVEGRESGKHAERGDEANEEEAGDDFFLAD